MKKLFVLLLTFVLMLMTAACFPTGPRQKENPAEPPASESVSDEVSDNSPTEPEEIKIEKPEPLYGEPEKLTRDMIPERYEEEIADSLIISAEVIAPDNIEFGSVAAKEVVYPSYEDQGELVELFLDGDFEHEYYDNEDDPDYFLDKYFSSKGEELSFHNRGIDYFRDAIYYRDVDPADYYYLFDYNFYYDGAVGPVSARLNEIYTLDKLNGIDKDWAISLVKEKVDSISAITGIEYMEKPEVYCLDSVSAKKYNDIISISYGSRDFDFTEDRNAYLIYFHTAFFGDPVSQNAWSNPNNNNDKFSPIGAYAYGIVDSKGLVMFDTGPGYVPVSEKLPEERLYNVDVVKRTLTDEYGKLNTKNMNIITDIYLEYVSESDQSEQYYIYRPYWVCYFCKIDKKNYKEGEPMLYDPIGALYINAMTGKLLNTQDVRTVRL